jgi:hypothetical protein
MKSELLQKKSHCLDKSDALLDGQQENIEEPSLPWEGTETAQTGSAWLLTPGPRFVNTAHSPEPNLRLRCRGSPGRARHHRLWFA